MYWHTEQFGSVQVLTVTGRLDAHSTYAIREWLDHASATPRPQVLICLGGVHFIDSASLGTLAEALNQCRARGGQLVLAELSQPARITFELTQLDQIFPIAATKAKALALFDQTQRTETS